MKHNMRLPDLFSFYKKTAIMAVFFVCGCLYWLLISDVGKGSTFCADCIIFDI